MLYPQYPQHMQFIYQHYTVNPSPPVLKCFSVFCPFSFTAIIFLSFFFALICWLAWNEKYLSLQWWVQHKKRQVLCALVCVLPRQGMFRSSRGQTVLYFWPASLNPWGFVMRTWANEHIRVNTSLSVQHLHLSLTWWRTCWKTVVTYSRNYTCFETDAISQDV